ncbi:MAG: UDP-2,3-diacylglucosamine diphosphatase [Siphonobacter sp.]
MEVRTHFRTIVLSDIHLGSKGSKAKEVTGFLKQYTCDKLILNGDIIDGWQLKKYGNSWKKKHTAFFRQILKMIEQYDTRVIYLRGNHDDFLDHVLPLKVGKHFSIRLDYVLKTRKGYHYYVTHGDIFDRVTTHLKWLAYVGDAGYTLLLGINKFYNKWRAWRGLPYYSLSQEIKLKVKAAVNYISDFEEKLADLARSKGCQGIICGHIHQPIIRMIGDIEYLNSGDWVESLTALVEDHEGTWNLVYYSAHLNQPEEEPSSEEDDEYDDDMLKSLLSLSSVKS